MGKRIGMYVSEFKPGIVFPDDIDASALMAALVEMRNFWRHGNAKGDGKETYSVEMMGAVGRVIAEAEKVIDFE